MKLSRLNATGVERFAKWLDLLRGDGTLDPPLGLLQDPYCTETIGVDVELKDEVFLSRFEAASTLYAAFSSTGLTGIEHDRGMWAWLSLFYIDSTCPLVKGGRQPGAQARHIPEPHNFQRYYRHLLAGPYRIYRAYRDHPETAMSLLCQPVHKPGDVVEQIAARQERVTNAGVVGLATRIYVDADKRHLKRGASGKGAGSVRRLIDLIDQLELTWDIALAQPSELASVLPKEFAKFVAEK
jgi:hypothetical protein